MKRVMVFIDGSNLYHGLKKMHCRTDVDLGKMSIQLVGTGREFVRTYYYNSPVDRRDGEEIYQNQQRFFETLKRIDDLELCLGRIAKRPDGTRAEKGVDVKLAVHMLSKAYKDHFDEAVLVSADGDFADLIQCVKDAGKKVEVAYPERPYHLAAVADRFVGLDAKFMAKCWINADKETRG